MESSSVVNKKEPVLSMDQPLNFDVIHISALQNDEDVKHLSTKTDMYDCLLHITSHNV